MAEDARLIDVTTDGEKRVMAALLGRREALSLLQAFESINSLNPEEKHDLISRSLENLEACDPPPREFELMDFMMEVILSATAFAQFKRHRMATLLPGPYNPGLGWTVPPSIQAIHETQCFTKVMNSSTELARHLAEINPALAAYTLTNAHRRRCIFKANARELYHFSRLREDIHAQWDIRALANRIIALARQAAPTLMMMAAGKHEFARQKESVFGSK